ncbi:MAG TPA: MBL fold metallo-hydrolase [Vicinamibacterales bacterium]|jgi:metallo-beta-lactamase class B|nr:MBL fold metallo-hydrolase [Vicinamibacterales bacterium]
MRGTRITTLALACLATGALISAQTAGPAPGESLSQSYRGSQSRNVEYQKIAPFKVMDNVYYVGPGSVSVWLVPTNAGLILIDTAQEPYVDTVIDNIRKVGFDPKNIKYILLTHGHLDHFGGANKIKALSGARVALTEGDWNFMEQQAKARPPKAGDEPPARDMVIKEGDTITLGDTKIKVYVLPGHTPASPAYEFTVYDNKKPYKGFVFGGPGPRNGVQGGTEFLQSIERLEKNFTDVQVALNVHSYLNSYPYPNNMGILELRDVKAKNPNGPNPFINNALWRQWLKDAHAGAVKYIAEEKAKAEKGQTN